MKLKTAKPMARAVKPTVAAPRGNLISKLMVDKYSAYNGNRIPVNSGLVKPVLGVPLPSKLTHTGYLLVEGKHGTLLREIHHNGKGLYRRDDDQKYGSLDAFNNLGRKDFSAKILTQEEVLALAAQFNKAVEVTHAKTKTPVRAFLLNSFGDTYVAALTVKEDRLVVVNMEHPKSYNKKDVQYTDPKNLKLAFKAFFAGV